MNQPSPQNATDLLKPAAGYAFLCAAVCEAVITTACVATVMAGLFSYRWHGSWVLTCVLTAGSLYAAAALTLICLALLFRLSPLRRSGPVQNPWQAFGFCFSVALSSFLIRSLAGRLLHSPWVAMWFYRGCGSRVTGPVLHAGKDAVVDPWGVDLGSNVVIGMGASVYSHLTPGIGAPFAKPVRIGDHALIGISTVVLPGAQIGARAVVLPNSVVTCDTVIPEGETWGGSPAVCKRPATLKRAA